MSIFFSYVSTYYHIKRNRLGPPKEERIGKDRKTPVSSLRRNEKGSKYREQIRLDVKLLPSIGSINVHMMYIKHCQENAMRERKVSKTRRPRD